MPFQLPVRRLACLLLCTALATAAGCGGKRTIPTREGEMPEWMGTIRDLRTFPQDLRPFARKAGGSAPLLTEREQRIQDERFNRIFFGPWDMLKTSVKRRDMIAPLRRARGYKYDGVRWTQEEWNAIARNANGDHFPSMRANAITVRYTDLREVPTHMPRYAEPTPDPRANPFDYNQYSLLPVGTPLLIAHSSRDGQWFYVETPVAAGWVDARDAAFTGEDFQTRYRQRPLAALLRDKVRLDGTQAAYAHIGALLPLASSTPSLTPPPEGGKAAGSPKTATRPETGTEPRWTVLVPEKGPDGYARLTRASLSLQEAAPKPLPLTPDALASVGNVMMGQRYGWGGAFGNRDCSALTRELFTPFGIWLPRNSLAQCRTGKQISLEGLTPKAKERALLEKGSPFLSLVWMRGHIMLYVGPHNGRPAIFHNAWGVRVVNGDDDNARFVLGRAVVTSLTPGAELPNLYRKTTFVDRLRKISTLPGDRD